MLCVVSHRRLHMIDYTKFSYTGFAPASQCQCHRRVPCILHKDNLIPQNFGWWETNRRPWLHNVTVRVGGGRARLRHPWFLRIRVESGEQDIAIRLVSFACCRHGGKQDEWQERWGMNLLRYGCLYNHS